VALADPGADRAALTLGLATALLDEGRAAEAEKVLNEFVGLRGSAWQLRAGLAALALRKMEAAGAAVAAVKETELTEGDRAWWFFAQALLAGAAGDVEQAQAAEQVGVELQVQPLVEVHVGSAVDDYVATQGDFPALCAQT
jgi:hypothetical protein